MNIAIRIRNGVACFLRKNICPVMRHARLWRPGVLGLTITGMMMVTSAQAVQINRYVIKDNP